MKQLLRTGSLATIFIVVCACFSFSADTTNTLPLFSGRITEDNVNIRTDSTTSSAVICAIKKDEYVDVMTEFFEWYKIRLPITAPAFIKKSFLEVIDSRSGRVLNNNVNIRLHPTTNGPIIGNVQKNETVFISEDRQEWYKIYPTVRSFGWINKAFVKKVAGPRQAVVEKAPAVTPLKPLFAKERIVLVSIEGTIKAKTFTKTASHKLVDKNKKVYLLSSSALDLSAYNNTRVRITGILTDPSKQTEPLVEVKKIEALD